MAQESNGAWGGAPQDSGSGQRRMHWMWGSRRPPNPTVLVTCWAPAGTTDQVPALLKLPPQCRAQKLSRDVSCQVGWHSAGRGPDFKRGHVSQPAPRGKGRGQTRSR